MPCHLATSPQTDRGDVGLIRWRRKTGFEPATFSLARRRATTAPLPLAKPEVGAEEETRTPTLAMSTAPSTLRVYQFHHLGTEAASGRSGGTRTPDLRFWRPLLCQTELHSSASPSVHRQAAACIARATDRLSPMATLEGTINIALGEVLADLRKGWTVHAEEAGGVLREGGRPDVLVLESAGWPVVVEAERTNHTSAEQDAVARLRKHPAESDFPIETAIALVYPPELHDVNGAKLRAAIRSTGSVRIRPLHRERERRSRPPARKRLADRRRARPGHADPPRSRARAARRAARQHA